MEDKQAELTVSCLRNIKQRNLKEAVRLCIELNTTYPKNFEGWRLAGILHKNFNKPKAGLVSTSKALELKPNNPEILIQRFHFLSQLQRIDEAKKILSTLASLKVTDSSTNSQIAMLFSSEEMHSEAIKKYEAAIFGDPSNYLLHFNLAVAYRFIGNLDNCENSLNRCLKLNPKDSEAQSMRSSLKRQTIESNHISELLEISKDSRVTSADKVGIYYALAKELDDLDEFTKSFSYLKKASKIRKSKMQYDVQIDKNIMHKLIETFKTSSSDDNTSLKSNPTPIFILGLPRTGSTLLERILDCHSEIVSCGELDHFGREIITLCRETTRDKQLSILELIELSRDINFDKLKSNYLEKAVSKNSDCRYFIDKLPLNFLYIAHILQSFPNAKIIRMKRHPMAFCFAIFKQNFRDIYPYSYDLKDIAKYYVSYENLMNHWKDLFPNMIYELNYEDLVKNTKPEIEKVCEFCDLAFESNCLNFYKNKNPVTTASAVQVRQPVYTDSLDRWKNFEDYLQPFSSILTKNGIQIDR